MELIKGVERLLAQERLHAQERERWLAQQDGKRSSDISALQNILFRSMLTSTFLERDI